MNSRLHLEAEGFISLCTCLLWLLPALKDTCPHSPLRGNSLPRFQELSGRSDKEAFSKLHTGHDLMIERRIWVHSWLRTATNWFYYSAATN